MPGVGTLVPKLARLRAVRDAQFMTQEELAERSGIHQVTISRIEQGDVEPRYRTIKRLAEALGVEPNELVSEHTG